MNLSFTPDSVCKYVDVCVQLYRIIPISPSDGTTKVERCEGVNVSCEAGEAWTCKNMLIVLH